MPEAFSLSTEELELLDTRPELEAAIAAKNAEIAEGDRLFEASREAYSELRARREGEKRALQSSQARVGAVLEKLRLAIPKETRVAPELAEAALRRHELQLPALRRSAEQAAKIAQTQPSQESNAARARADEDLAKAEVKRAELVKAAELATAELAKARDALLAQARAFVTDKVEKTDEAEKGEKKKARAARGA